MESKVENGVGVTVIGQGIKFFIVQGTKLKCSTRDGRKTAPRIQEMIEEWIELKKIAK